MLERLKQSLGGKLRPKSSTVADPELGPLSWSEIDRAWLSNREYREVGFVFQICGTPLPSPAHVLHAAGIVAHKGEFIRNVRRLLEIEAVTSVAFRKFRSEIAGLSIERVSLCWADLPGHGIIYFEGGRADRLWGCYCSDCIPSALGFKGPDQTPPPTPANRRG